MKSRAAKNTTRNATDSDPTLVGFCDTCLRHGQVGAGRSPLLSPAGYEFQRKLLIFSFAMPVVDRPRCVSISKSHHVEASRSVCPMDYVHPHYSDHPPMLAPWCSSSKGVIPLFSCPADICNQWDYVAPTRRIYIR